MAIDTDRFISDLKLRVIKAKELQKSYGDIDEIDKELEYRTRVAVYQEIIHDLEGKKFRVKN